MNRDEIKILLIRRGFLVAELARTIGHSRTWTSQVLYGHAKSDSTRRAIARTLGVKVSELWPSDKEAA